METPWPGYGSWKLKAIAAGGVRLEGRLWATGFWNLQSRGTVLLRDVHTDTVNVLKEQSVNYPGNLDCY